MDIIAARAAGLALCPRIMSGRRLSPDDRRLWDKLTRTVRPLDAGPHKGPAADPYMRVHSAPGPILHHQDGEVQVRADKSVRKGRVDIGAKIDLHDFTRDQAFPVLVRGIERAHRRGVRCVLVVTGKGANLEGVLRMSLPGWLMEPQIRPLIANFASAHIRHGGSGAYYVFLKRKH